MSRTRKFLLERLLGALATKEKRGLRTHVRVLPVMFFRPLLSIVLKTTSSFVYSTGILG